MQQGSEHQVLSTRLPAVVASCIEGDVDEVIQRYDAVLVDEGSGFSSNLVECVAENMSQGWRNVTRR